MSGTSVKFLAAAGHDQACLVSFPCGVSRQDVQMQAYQKLVGRKRKLLLESSLGGVKFQGSDFGANNPSNDVSGLSIGVYDEATGSIKLYNAGHAFTMHQEKDDVPHESSISSMSALERRQSLTDTFGSKKKKRALRAAESNVISSQNIVAAETIGDMLTESVASSRKDKISSPENIMPSKSAIDQHRDVMLPPHNTSATTLKEAYPFSGLAPRHVLEALHEWTDDISGRMSGGGNVEDWQQKLVADCSSQTLRDIFDVKICHLDGKKFKKALASLVLCDLMIRVAIAFSQTPKPIVKDNLEQALFNPPSQLLRHVTDNFAVFRKSFGKNAFVSSKILIDKLLMHIMVLLLHLNDGVINLSTFTKDMDIASTRVMTLARETGCSSIKMEGKERVQINLPLKFPEIKKGGVGNKK